MSYVRCQRCDRPACPQCQRSAEVGVQCVDCVASAQRNLPAEHRPPRFADKHGQPIPVVTYVLIALCGLAYVAQWATNGLSTGVTESLWYAGFYTSAASLDSQFAALSGIGFEPWRMLTSAFLHSMSSPMHLLLNMVVLWMMGRTLEPALGWARFLAIYLISAFGGSVAVLLLANPLAPVVGASGAVYGLFAALFLMIRRIGGSVVSIGALIAVNLVISVVWSGISWQAHVGGLVVGAACAAVLLFQPKSDQTLVGAEEAAQRRRRIRRRQWWGLAGVVVILMVITAIGAMQITPESLLAARG
ncbi:rhomboid family intramembrane serine protease [Citricoccus muralis]|uniref:Rhomboid family intramembrane serine protease n=1 Tax=Citricoccus muralis TaxID=169134 RepID=A0ABY8H677_9MICC|nr:rhomboid family intramembrane serine protease [Citricoccus muralis]WFP16644.1 rhomboid family intramembrane serine protease [Citricoccus muralis]